MRLNPLLVFTVLAIAAPLARAGNAVGLVAGYDDSPVVTPKKDIPSPPSDVKRGRSTQNNNTPAPVPAPVPPTTGAVSPSRSYPSTPLTGNSGGGYPAKPSTGQGYSNVLPPVVVKPTEGYSNVLPPVVVKPTEGYSNVLPPVVVKPTEGYSNVLPPVDNIVPDTIIDTKSSPGYPSTSVKPTNSAIIPKPSYPTSSTDKPVNGAQKPKVDSPAPITGYPTKDLPVTTKRAESPTAEAASPVGAKDKCVKKKSECKPKKPSLTSTSGGVADSSAKAANSPKPKCRKKPTKCKKRDGTIQSIAPSSNSPIGSQIVVKNGDPTAPVVPPTPAKPTDPKQPDVVVPPPPKAPLGIPTSTSSSGYTATNQGDLSAADKSGARREQTNSLVAIVAATAVTVASCMLLL